STIDQRHARRARERGSDGKVPKAIFDHRGNYLAGLAASLIAVTEQKNSLVCLGREQALRRGERGGNIGCARIRMRGCISDQPWVRQGRAELRIAAEPDLSP